MSQRHEYAREGLELLLAEKERQAESVAHEIVRSMARRDPEHHAMAKLRIGAKVEADAAYLRRVIAAVDVVAKEDEGTNARDEQRRAIQDKTAAAERLALAEAKRIEAARERQTFANRRAMDALATLERITGAPNALLTAKLQAVAVDPDVHDLYRDQAIEALKSHEPKRKRVS